MRKVRRKLSAADTSALSFFLSSENRPEGTLNFHELQGFLFTVACSPETIQPSEWLPIISNDEEIGFQDETEAQQVLNQIMTLYNQVNSTVLERSSAMPTGCEFQPDILANFDETSSVSQWARGFAFGHDWLSEAWDQAVPESLDEECGASVMALSFFSSRSLAQAFFAEVDPAVSQTSARSFEQFAEMMRELFPEALSSYAHLGRTIFEVLIKRADAGL
jgi:yecA family protein